MISDRQYPPPLRNTLLMIDRKIGSTCSAPFFVSIDLSCHSLNMFSIFTVSMVSKLAYFLEYIVMEQKCNNPKNSNNPRSDNCAETMCTSSTMARTYPTHKIQYNTQSLKKRHNSSTIIGHSPKDSIIIFWHSIDLINFAVNFNQTHTKYHGMHFSQETHLSNTKLLCLLCLWKCE